MFGSRHHEKTARRGAVLTLAVLALLSKVAVPAGFMIAARPPSDGGGSSFTLVICTGHGAQGAMRSDQKGGHNKPQSDTPCAFTGHAAPPAAALRATMIGSAYAQAVARAWPLADLTPGRGLAAPPPPSRGPPRLL